MVSLPWQSVKNKFRKTPTCIILTAKKKKKIKIWFVNFQIGWREGKYIIYLRHEGVSHLKYLLISITETPFILIEVAIELFIVSAFNDTLYS